MKSIKHSKTGVSSVLIKPTKKQKQQRKEHIKNEVRNYHNKVGRFLGSYIYRCSNCKNRVRLQEDLTDRKVLCTKCNAGVFEPAKR